MKENMQPVAIYHRVMRRENFETAAKDLIGLLAEAQKTQPDRPRKLYLDIDGHRNEAGGFDADMLELQKEFGIEFLLQYFTEVHFPLGTIANQGEQNNDVPDHFEIFHAAENGVCAAFFPGKVDSAKKEKRSCRILWRASVRLWN